MRIVILLGPPGAGKGTQAAFLKDMLGIPHISSGDLFRENIRKQTPLGREAKEIVERGELPRDELALDMLYERIKSPDCSSGYLLDGIPRTLNQAEQLSKFWGDQPVEVLLIDVPDPMVIERLSGRLVCSQCQATCHRTFNPPKVEGVCDVCGGTLIQRKDDSEEVIMNRLKVYRKQTAPLIDYYEEQGNLLRVDGSRSPKETTAAIEVLI